MPFTATHVWFPWNTSEFESLAASNLQQTLMLWIVLVLTGLAVAFAFRCGLFNIGGQGQYLAGSIGAVIVATELPHAVDLPRWLLIIATMLGGMLAGAAIAGIAGFLKGTVGAHEVITTIMLNWIVIWVGSYLFGLGGPLQTEAPETAGTVPSSADIPEKAKLPGLLGGPGLQGRPHRHLPRARGARRLLDHAQSHDARIRGASRRPQPRGGALRRHQRRAQLLPRDGDRRPVRGTRRRARHRRLGVSSRHDADLGVVRSASSASPSRLLGRNTAVGVGLAALLFAALDTGTASRNLDPSYFPPDLASSLAIIIQGLIVLFVGADIIVLLALQTAEATSAKRSFLHEAAPARLARRRLDRGRRRRLRRARRAAPDRGP